MSIDKQELQLLGVSEAAGILGIKEQTLRQWFSEQRFPYVKVGRRTMVSLADLADFVEGNRIRPAKEQSNV